MLPARQWLILTIRKDKETETNLLMKVVFALCKFLSAGKQQEQHFGRSHRRLGTLEYQNKIYLIEAVYTCRTLSSK